MRVGVYILTMGILHGVCLYGGNPVLLTELYVPAVRISMMGGIVLLGISLLAIVSRSFKFFREYTCRRFNIATIDLLDVHVVWMSNGTKS